MKFATKMSPRKKLYTAQDVLFAIAEIKNQSLRVRQAAAKYNIPASTLFDKLSGKCPAGKFKPGNFLLNKYMFKTIKYSLGKALVVHTSEFL